VSPFPLGQATVYGGEPGGVALDVASGCQSDICSAVLSSCGEHAYAEVMLDRAGTIADVVCYRDDLRVQELGTSPVIGLDDEPDTLFIFDAVDDGPDLYGDTTLSQDNVWLFGNGARVSVLSGGLAIEGESATVRGIRIAGDVTIDRDGANLSLVEIQGELVINADDVTLAESLVRGRVRVNGSRTLLVRNLLGDGSELSGEGLKCNLNQYFNDIDLDGAIERVELGAEVPCR